MTLAELLSSLTPEERDFIASRDYGADRERHRAALDVVLANGGVVEFDTQGVWYPYEVIELGKSALQPGHEREFAACVGIVLLNVKRGGDRCNLEEDVLDSQRDALDHLPEELRRVLASLTDP
jgi:hypothetical protein